MNRCNIMYIPYALLLGSKNLQTINTWLTDIKKIDLRSFPVHLKAPGCLLCWEQKLRTKAENRTVAWSVVINWIKWGSCWTLSLQLSVTIVPPGAITMDSTLSWLMRVHQFLKKFWPTKSARFKTYQWSKFPSYAITKHMIQNYIMEGLGIFIFLVTYGT